VILLMLRFPKDGAEEDDDVTEDLEASLVATPIALEAYHEAFTALVKDHPECWHLCQRAEDRCRAEHFPRLARRLESSLGRPASWSEVFTAAAEDDRYWDREVRRPALGFLARGKRQSLDAGEAALDSSSGRKAKRPKTAPEKILEKEERPNHAARSGATGRGSAGGDHPRKNFKTGMFSTTREGKEICFKFSDGSRGACKEPCPAKRAHVCQICLQPHANKVCTKKV
jgi:hypothetical protein